MTVYEIKTEPCWVTVYDENHIQKRLDLGYNKINIKYNMTSADIDNSYSFAQKYDTVFIDDYESAIERCNQLNAERQTKVYKQLQTEEY